VRRIGLALLPVVALLLAGIEGPAWAIPAFARRYETACSTCHVQFPKLNQFGEAFRRNGYQYPGTTDAAAVQQQPLTLVNDAYKTLFPDAYWPSSIPSYPPVAFELNGGVPIFPDPAVRPVGERAVTFDRMFTNVALLLGAQLGRDVAAFGSLWLSSQSGVQLQRGFLTVSNLAGSALSLRVGQFEPQILSISDYRRIAGPTYWILSDPIAHDNWQSDFVRGLDVAGTFFGRLGYNAAWVQGVEGSYSGAELRQVPRDGYAHLYAKIGGLRLDGIEPQSDTSGATLPGREESVLIGGFVYGGKHDVDTTGDPTRPPEGDDLWKTGGDVDVLFGPLELLLAGAWERHRFEGPTPGEQRIQGLQEGTWAIFPWLVAGLRGEEQRFGGATSVRVTPFLSVHPRIDIKVQAWAQVERLPAYASFTPPPGFRLEEIDIAAAYAF
jgi:hypothetical protein